VIGLLNDNLGGRGIRRNVIANPKKPQPLARISRSEIVPG
jgi:hypothetical protein